MIRDGGLLFGHPVDNVSGWLVVMHTYLCYFMLSLSHCPLKVAYIFCAV